MPAGRTRRRTGSALVPAGFALLLALLAPGAARAQDDAPPSSPPAKPSHTRAYVALGTGAALTGLSFVIAEQADRDYAAYLAETDPSRLEDSYQKAKRGDRLAAGVLIAGQAALALGIYWRFLHHPRELQTRSPAWGLAPRVGPGGAGLAVDVRF